MTRGGRRPAAQLNPESLLLAYRQGFFPMAETRQDDDIFWLNPDYRGVLPLDAVHVPRRLARTMRKSQLQMKVDTAFAAVIAECAASRADRPNTWISGLIERSYATLHERGAAHSVEVWNGDRLVGGLYGVAIGAAFFGESMFSRETDASKMALIHLVARLRAGGFRLLDTQFITEHLRQFGALEIPRDEYRRRLKGAVDAPANFYELGGTGAVLAPGAVLQLITQTS